MGPGWFIYPQNGGVRATMLDCRLNPADSLFIDKVIAAAKAVNLCQDEHFLAGLNLGTVIEHVVDGYRSSAGHSL